MAPPLVSFLIPAYNHAAFVCRCLDSVLEDVYENKEIVIVDDGSADETGKLIQNWIDLHASSIHVQFRSRPNRGVTATLNELVSMARGEFVRLGASDDYFLPHGTCKLVDYLLANPAKSAVIGDSVVVDEGGNFLFDSGIVDLHRTSKRLYRSETGIVKAVISQWAVAGPVPLLRRSAIVSNCSWNESLRIDDWDFFLRIAAQDALGFVDTQVCAYRIHSSNTCRVSDRTVRIRNLKESHRVAQSNVARFRRPYSDLLRAQCKLVDAKIAFLQRQTLPLILNLLAYAKLKAVALVAGWGLVHGRRS